ncbi:hypothetical protein M6B38_128900 [Iris pallida]|uniref:Uncharacterized protein n=1 Tax=Iris pallida TaxID=29817 RepID=A0AAX6G5B6_IRIPA|nr:hypothetical protein M6B38_128900 [Iris pallida]
MVDSGSRTGRGVADRLIGASVEIKLLDLDLYWDTIKLCPIIGACPSISSRFSSSGYCRVRPVVHVQVQLCPGGAVHSIQSIAVFVCA